MLHAQANISHPLTTYIMAFQNDINQNLRKIGPNFSATDEKQRQVVQMIKRYEIKTEIRSRVNMEIPGLRKKKTPFSTTPNNKRLWESLSSFERNGILNVGLSRNFVRFIFPTIPAFFFVYMCSPVIHGHIGNQQYMNYQWKGVYFKFGSDRLPMVDQSITRIA